ncbi:MAG: hypothetical protein LBC07_06690 [Elusimicrobiota bacterium]|nr:hypothetical protein [Elusimicrobiota bacterium]
MPILSFIITLGIVFFVYFKKVDKIYYPADIYAEILAEVDFDISTFDKVEMKLSHNSQRFYAVYIFFQPPHSFTRKQYQQKGNYILRLKVKRGNKILRDLYIAPIYDGIYGNNMQDIYKGLSEDNNISIEVEVIKPNRELAELFGRQKLVVGRV